MPQPTAGYSETPLPKKLGVKESSRVLLAGAPEGFELAGAKLVAKPPANIVVWFCIKRSSLAKELPKRIEQMGEGMLWICWPKKSSGVATDLTEDALREEALPLGIVDSKVCAIDATWSGLRFTRRRR